MRDHKPIKLTPSKFQSALTNGSVLIRGVDGRSAWMRRLRDLIANHISDLGGEDCISQSERILINRASMLTLQLEAMEQVFARNDGIAKSDQIETYQRCLNTLRRTLETLGLARRSKALPTLQEYIDGEVEAAE